MKTPKAKIVGGGLAGLSAAVALESLGWEVHLHEAKPFLGGRATSFPVRPDEPDSERIDNCQHVLLRCCDNLLDFYRRCGVAEKIRFYDKLYFGWGRAAPSILSSAVFCPTRCTWPGLSCAWAFLSWRDKLSLASTLRALQRDGDRPDLDRITFKQWLDSRKATATSYERFWRPIIVSALNEEPSVASAKPAFQVFRQGMLGTRTSYEMGVPAAPLAELYDGAGDRVNVHMRSTVGRIDPASDEADVYISAVSFERVNELIPGLAVDAAPFEHSPITGVHLWFDRPVTSLPHAVLLDRTMQWLFRKSDTYVQCVVSASRDLLPMSRGDIVELACRELREFFPAAHECQARALARGQGGAGHLFDPARSRGPSPRAADALQQRLPGRRLDRHRLARHDGRRRPQRLPGRRKKPRDRKGSRRAS